MRVAVVGCGFVGQSWATIFARAGHDVAVHDVSASQRVRGRADVLSNLDLLHDAGLISEAPSVVASRIRFCDQLEDALAGAEYVQENVSERLDAKVAIFAQLDRSSEPGATLASSSSGICCSDFCADLPGRHRCLIAHPANPPHLLPVVEIVPAPFTAPDVVGRAEAFFAQAGITPVRVRQELPGFVMNRLQAALVNEALSLVEQDVATARDIDTIVKSSLGLRWSFMGPFETMDLNAPGGFADYARRYGPTFSAVGGSMAGGWPAKAVASVDDERRSLLPRHEMENRRAWRDARLVDLLAREVARSAQTEF